MPHINLDPNLPGMRSLLAFRPEIAGPLANLTNTLLRSNDGLTMAERELIGTYVSKLNDCFYCHHSHRALAVCYLDDNDALVDEVIKDYTTAPISDKLKALLVIAASVQKGGLHVTPYQVEAAKALGATDLEIHDTVLVAALFSLFNRYVDGLATNFSTDLSVYPPRAKQTAQSGYGPPVGVNVT
jgi:uncharacterized peroxidase-related enzyme